MMDFSYMHCVSFIFFFIYFKFGDLFFSNDSTDGEPEEKRRKVANVVINQTTTDSKVLVDNVPESSSIIEEVY